MADPPTREYLQQKVDEYRAFYRQTVLPDLEFAANAHQETQQESDDYVDLQNRLRSPTLLLSPAPSTETTIETGGDSGGGDNTSGNDSRTVTTTVDLGYGRLFCKAEVELDRGDETAAFLFVDVGMGFHVELSRKEALEFLERKIAQLRTKLGNRAAALRRVEDHAQSSQNILRQLEEQMQRVDEAA